MMPELDSVEAYRRGWCPICRYAITILPSPIPQEIAFEVPASVEDPRHIEHAPVIGFEYCPGGHGGPIYYDPVLGRQTVGDWSGVRRIPFTCPALLPDPTALQDHRIVM
jgi:hypothetical protein